MKKILTMFVLFLSMVFCNQGHAGYTYTLDIDIPDVTAITEEYNRIGGLEFITSTVVDNYILGNAVTNWTFENYGGFWWCISDDYTDFTGGYSDISWMTSGRVVTIVSDDPIIFEDVFFYSFEGDGIPETYYTTTGFTAVPIPATVFLLFSGILCMLGMKRIKK